MTYSEIQKYHNDILKAVMDSRLRDALSMVSKLIVQVSSSDIQNRYQSITDTFRNMLKYSFELAPDPERSKIFNNLQKSILELSDDIRESWIRTMDLFERKKALERSAEFENEYASRPEEVCMKLSKREDPESQTEGSSEILKEQNVFAGLVFYYLDLKTVYTESTEILVRQIIDDDEIEEKIKSMLISSVSMSGLRHFDRKKIILLFDFSKHENPEIRQRAMIGLFLMILMNSQRISLHKDILERLESIPDDPLFQERMLAILLQFIRASETEKSKNPRDRSRETTLILSKDSKDSGSK